MLNQTRKLYERLGKRAKLPAKALEILIRDDKRTPYKGVPYTIGNVYAVLNGKYEDSQVEAAIIEAARKHLAEEKSINSNIKESIAML